MGPKWGGFLHFYEANQYLSAKREAVMRRIWNKCLKESLIIFCAIYTVVTILNSILYLSQGYRDDPSGNWHELTRAVIILIGIIAFEMVKNLPIKNVVIKAVVIYIPTMSLAFGFVWMNQFIEPLASSAYRDIFINYTSVYVVVSVIVLIKNVIKNKKNQGKQR